MNSKIAVITGASSGIGAATALRFAKEGFEVIVGARRVDRLHDITDETGGRALPLDVTDPDSVIGFAESIERADVLVNNAGLALGLDPLAEASEDDMRRVWETNVFGVVRITRALLPKINRDSGHIVNVGSTAGRQVYEGGGLYTSSKHALRALTQTLRLELFGTAIRVTEVAPGLVETEFSKVRFAGDNVRARKVYEGVKTLTAEDVADAIAWAVTRPPHVNIDEIVVMPLAQASPHHILRDQTE